MLESDEYGHRVIVARLGNVCDLLVSELPVQNASAFRGHVLHRTTAMEVNELNNLLHQFSCTPSAAEIVDSLRREGTCEFFITSTGTAEFTQLMKRLHGDGELLSSLTPYPTPQTAR